MTSRIRPSRPSPTRYPLATIAAYGPDNTLATKLVSTISPSRANTSEPRLLIRISRDAGKSSSPPRWWSSPSHGCTCRRPCARRVVTGSPATRAISRSQAAPSPSIAVVRSASRSTLPIGQASVGIFDPGPAIVRRLIDAGADVNVADNVGVTPLLRAAGSKETDIVRLLLEKGADPCRRENDGTTVVDNSSGPYPELQAMTKAAFARCRQ